MTSDDIEAAMRLGFKLLFNPADVTFSTINRGKWKMIRTGKSVKPDFKFPPGRICCDMVESGVIERRSEYKRSWIEFKLVGEIIICHF